MTRRSPNLTSDRIDLVVDIIRGWDGRLTWPALIQAIAKRMRATYTRQALYNQERIRIAYETYRASSNASGISGRPVSVRDFSQPTASAIEQAREPSTWPQ